MVSFANGGISDPKTGTIIYPGYPDWWYQEAGYQYGPGVYDVEALDSIADVAYTNETVYVKPGREKSISGQTRRRLLKIDSSLFGK